MRSSGSTSITDVRLVTADTVTSSTTVVVGDDGSGGITSGTPPPGARDGRGAVGGPGRGDSP
ncbi:MAG: hypothetical protein AAGF91_13335, partial [Actinomycetota bacterium]